MNARIDRLRDGVVTALMVAAIVLASVVGLDSWADDAAVHVGTAAHAR